MVRIKNIEEYAKSHNVPIIERDGIEFLIKYIRDNKITRILEIGTAIGYSAIKMALVDANIQITTIERDKEKFDKAIDNIKAFKLEKQINAILSDALSINVDGKFELIFIDAAKSQSIKFFERFKHNLASGGTIITDNMNFHGLVDSKEELSKNVKGIVSKIKLYIKWLDENKEFTTIYLNVGDGLAISQKTQ